MIIDSDGISKGIVRLDRCMEDDNGRDYDRYMFGVSDAICQRRDLIQGHV